MMKHSLKTGFSFGITSGIITTLGLMVGLHSSTNSKLIVIGGVLIIAIADAFSDALGIHMSEESENKHSAKEIWESTIFTSIAKFVVASTFVIPVLLLQLSIAIIVSVVYGLSLLGIFSFYISKGSYRNRLGIVIEHLVIAFVVIIITHYLGDWIGSTFV